MTRIGFYRMGLTHPTVRACFQGTYEAQVRGIRSQGIECELVWNIEEASRCDVLVFSLGGKQGQIARDVLRQLPVPGVFYVPPAVLWFDRRFFKRLGNRVLFAYGTDESPLTASQYATIGIDYLPLPFGSDPKIMRPIECEKVFDVALIANAGSGEGRLAYVKPLVEHFGAERCLIVGQGWQSIGVPEQTLAWGASACVLYNAARVCVNVHADEQYSDPESRLDANNRLFDVALCGVPQVDNAAVITRRYFTEDEVVVAHDPREWVAAIADLVGDTARQERLAHAARSRALREYTWDARAVPFVTAVSKALKARGLY